MSSQNIFQRTELKYLLTKEQKRTILQGMDPYMKEDAYGKTTIRNLYFDTDTYLLIRRSIEKPEYKEKLRMRSYSRAQLNNEVFVELKKKYKGTVHKRRIKLTQQEAMDWLCNGKPCTKDTQIAREIDYVMNYYSGLSPKVFLSYDREAYYGREDDRLRVTFDDNILFREEDLNLDSHIYGTRLLPEELVLMEIKCIGGMPLWMAKLLSQEKIYKTSFSKYGTAYREHIHPKQTGGTQ